MAKKTKEDVKAELMIDNDITPFMEELRTHVLAVYPMLWVMSHEEDRVTKEIRATLELLRERPLPGRQPTYFSYKEWTCCTGIRSTETPGRKDALEFVVDDKTMDIEEAIQAILDFPKDVVVVFKDVHHQLEDAGVRRKFRDAFSYQANVIKEDPPLKIFIVVSPTLAIPVDLEKDVTVLDFPLPDADKLRKDVIEINSGFDKKDFSTELADKEVEAIVRAAQGLTQSEFSNAVMRSIIVENKISAPVIAKEKEQIVKKSKSIELIRTVEVNQVGGMDNLKKWLEKRSSAWTPEGKKFGLPNPRGVLLLGVQGAGKSLVCKAIATMWGLQLMSLDIGKLFSQTVGSSEAQTRSALRTAEAMAPCVLMLDEIDKGLSGGASSNMSDGGTTSRVIGTILTWMQEHNTPVYLAATANSIASLPPELMRKGRFDEIWYVGLPNFQGREEIFRIHISKRNRNPEDFNINQLAMATENFSGAEIEQVVIDGLFEAFQNKTDLKQANILEAANNLVPLFETRKEDILALEQWVGYDSKKKDGVRAKFASSQFVPVKENSKDRNVLNISDLNNKK